MDRSSLGKHQVAIEVISCIHAIPFDSFFFPFRPLSLFLRPCTSPCDCGACFSPGRCSVTRGRPWGWHAENEDPVYVPRKPPCRKRSTTPAAWSGSLWGCAWCPAHRGEGLSAKCGNVSRAAKCFQILFRHFLLPVKVGVIKQILHKCLECCRFSWMISWCCSVSLF